MRRLVFAIFLVLFTPCFVLGDIPALPTKITPPEIRIGEQATLIVEFPAGMRSQPTLLLPADSSLKGLEFIKGMRMDTIPQQKNQPAKFRVSLLLTAFDSGFFPVPPIQFIAAGDTFYSEAALLSVQTIPVDTAQATIRPEKGIAEIPFDWREYIRPALLMLAILIALTAGFFLWKKLRPAKEILPEAPAPQEPPHRIALRALEELNSMQLWENGSYKEYHIRLSDIVRTYIENRFGFGALEQTTEEIMVGLRSLPAAQTVGLKEALTLADFVKFAKAVPIAYENRRSMEQAVAFIQITREESKHVVD